MQVEIRIDADCREPRVVIVTDRMSDEVTALAQRLTEKTPQVLTGFRDDALEVLEQGELLRAYAAGGKVYAVTQRGEYVLRLRLYELESRLDKSCFVRISNAEIINLRKVRRFDLSLAGTICVTLADGAVTYVSRRYVVRIKQVLGI